MTNRKDELIKETKGEEILAINIEGTLYLRGHLVAAMDRLDREFDSGYGLHEGFSFWAWTESAIYFCGLYDGAEWIEEIPRKPSEGMPCHVGGE